MKRAQTESWVLAFVVPALLTIILLCAVLHYLHRYQTRYGQLNPYPRNHASPVKSNLSR